jgi:hypothetical protein
MIDTSKMLKIESQRIERTQLTHRETTEKKIY